MGNHAPEENIEEKDDEMVNDDVANNEDNGEMVNIGNGSVDDYFCDEFPVYDPFFWTTNDSKNIDL